MNDAPSGGSTRGLLRRRRPILAIAAVGLICVFAWVYAGRPGQGVEIASTADNREPAPGFALTSLADDGVVIDLHDFSGMPVVVNFWASWCVPCRREMPALEAVHKRYADRVAFIGVNHQDTRSAAKALVAESGVTYTSVYDPGGEVAIAYGLYGMPTTVFVSADGRVAGRHTGELTPEDLRDALDEVLAR